MFTQKIFASAAMLLLLLLLLPNVHAQEIQLRASGGHEGALQGIGMPIITGVNDLIPIVKRGDVQSALHMDLKQKTALDELFTNGKTGVKINLTSTEPMSNEDRMKQVKDQFAAQMGSNDQKVKGILRPDQYERAQQLQLQWKGAIILGEQRVADRLKISREHQAAISGVVAEYQAVHHQVMMSMMERSELPSPGDTKMMVMKINTDELKNPLSPAYKTLTRAKAQAEQKILALLSGEERQSWNNAKGAPFTFRTDLPGLRF
jgi:hypothetical protein